MKTVSATFVIFWVYLHAADNINPVNILKGIGDTISDAAHEIIPDCIFGVQSVSMVLYTKDIPYGKNISIDKVCVDSDQSKPIVFLVHGFISNANYTNSYKLSEAFIKKGVTVYSLDWSDAACTSGLPVVKFLGYPSAVQNTCEIGELMADYVTSLIDKCDVPLDDIIFIGHSLGAHVSGFASKKIQELGYGTIPLLFGVDPAQPLFLLNTCEKRICNTDAKITFIFHTSPLGIARPIGNIDLYFNGGIRQPRCMLDIPCSHSIGILYLAEIVNYNCGFPGVSMSYLALKTLIREPPYPQKNTTECFFMDRTIFNRNRSFNKLTGKTYYMFVDSDKFCTSKSFSCQY